MHSRRPPARFGLLASAVATIAFAVAAPTAGAATIEGGPLKLDFKALTKLAAKPKVASNGADSKTKTGATFDLGVGTATLVAQSSGNLPVGGTDRTLTFSVGSKKAVISKIIEKLAAGKGTLTGTLGGKSVVLFNEASTGKIAPNAAFTRLTMKSSALTLTSKGAAALNKALGLKKPARGKPDKRLKAKQKAGTASFTGDRSLVVVSGSSKTIYDQAFVDTLTSCGITLSAVAPATPIPADSSAPRGGVDLPVISGTLPADTLGGSVKHSGGTVLDRQPPGSASNPTSKPAYRSELTDFEFNFGQSPFDLKAFVKNLNNAISIGTVTGTLAATLTDTGGSVALSNGSLNLSALASGNLSSNVPPNGADCPIPEGSKIGAVSSVINVE